MKKKTSHLSHSSIFWYNKEKYTEGEILSGILINSDKMIRYIYKSFFPGIKSMVGSFHNLSLDAEDIFQEGLTRAVINVRGHKFNGTSSFYTYLTSICRNICLKELKKPLNIQEIQNNSVTTDDEGTYKEDLIERMTAIKSKMDKACIQIIDLRFGLNNLDYTPVDFPVVVENRKFEEIAKLLNIEADNARQRFRRCFEKFKLVLFNDLQWKELID